MNDGKSPLTPWLELVRLLWRDGNKSRLEPHVQVKVAGGPHGERTEVTIDHLIPSDAEGGRPGLRVTTREQKLFRAHFNSRRLREAINSASRERGRRIYCIDLSSQEVVAAISYHIPEQAQHPVLITAIAQRSDGDAGLRTLSRAAAALLKQCVHLIAAAVNRGGHVDFESGSAAAEAELRTLGFQRAPKVAGRRPSGTMWRQRAPADAD